MDIEWKNPPESLAPGQQSPAGPFVEALKANPGRWAYYGRKGASISTYLRKRYGVEAVTRNSAGGKADIYARWNESP